MLYQKRRNRLVIYLLKLRDLKMNPYMHVEGDLTLYCFYEYERPLPATATDPAWEGCVTVCEVFINGCKTDAHGLINPSLIQQIESDILESLQ